MQNQSVGPSLFAQNLHHHPATLSEGPQIILMQTHQHLFEAAYKSKSLLHFPPKLGLALQGNVPVSCICSRVHDY